MSIKMFTTFAGNATGRLGYFMALALPAVVVAIEPAQAGGSANLNCVGSGRSFTCAATWGGGQGGLPRIVRVPASADEAEAAERERRWLARCQPVVEYDRHGVGRYYYKAAGCEFGRTAD